MDPLKTSSYDFILPQNQIATFALNPRDSAKLLVFNRKTNKIIHSTFNKILDFLPSNIEIIFNDTKVIKARIYGKKDTGGKIELLINKPHIDNEVDCYIKGKVNLNTILLFNENISAKITKIFDNGIRRVAFFKNNNVIYFNELIDILQNIGHIPLPPYINREAIAQDEVDYQTVFAKNKGAIAAPTASLHFTDELFEQITQKIPHHFITLHVGAGTFKPVKNDNILDHQMHSEWYNINQDTIDLLQSDKAILSVGTTVTRTIEFYMRTQKQSGDANLFLHPENKPKRVNHLLTNFHLPRSTLLMLVASFIGVETTQLLYKEAIKHNYRFYSYGDAMLII